jgi:hypothetical protein
MFETDLGPVRKIDRLEGTMETFEKREPTSRRAQADYIVERLTQFGVRINPSSRIGQAQRALRRPGIIQTDDPNYQIVLESIRDNYQLRLIVDNMDAHRESKAFKDAMYLLRKDFALPQSKLENTPGRNYQFQLYVAALCTNAGIPTRHDEPDVVCELAGMTVGIAAKRLKTIDSLDVNVKGAADQISNAGFPGIIALDLTIAQNPTNRRMMSAIESQWYSVLSDARARELFTKYGDRIRELVDGKNVLGVWTYVSTLRLRPDRSWSHDCWSFWYDTTKNAEEHALFELFQSGFLKGVPNLNDLTGRPEADE